MDANKIQSVFSRIATKFPPFVASAKARSIESIMRIKYTDFSAPQRGASPIAVSNEERTPFHADTISQAFRSPQDLTLFANAMRSAQRGGAMD
jgi:hypothetical protein